MVERKQKQNVKYEKENKKRTKNEYFIRVVAGHDNNNQLKKVSNFCIVSFGL